MHVVAHLAVVLIDWPVGLALDTYTCTFDPARLLAKVRVDAAVLAAVPSE